MSKNACSRFIPKGAKAHRVLRGNRMLRENFVISSKAAKGTQSSHSCLCRMSCVDVASPLVCKKEMLNRCRKEGAGLKASLKEQVWSF